MRTLFTNVWGGGTDRQKGATQWRAERSAACHLSSPAYCTSTHTSETCYTTPPTPTIASYPSATPFSSPTITPYPTTTAYPTVPYVSNTPQPTAPPGYPTYTPVPTQRPSPTPTPSPIQSTFKITERIDGIYYKSPTEKIDRVEMKIVDVRDGNKTIDSGEIPLNARVYSRFVHVQPYRDYIVTLLFYKAGNNPSNLARRVSCLSGADGGIPGGCFIENIHSDQEVEFTFDINDLSSGYVSPTVRPSTVPSNIPTPTPIPSLSPTNVLQTSKKIILDLKYRNECGYRSLVGADIFIHPPGDSSYVALPSSINSASVENAGKVIHINNEIELKKQNTASTGFLDLTIRAYLLDQKDIITQTSLTKAFDFPSLEDRYIWQDEVEFICTPVNVDVDNSFLFDNSRPAMTTQKGRNILWTHKLVPGLLEGDRDILLWVYEGPSSSGKEYEYSEIVPGGEHATSFSDAGIFSYKVCKRSLLSICLSGEESQETGIITVE